MQENFLIKDFFNFNKVGCRQLKLITEKTSNLDTRFKKIQGFNFLL